MHIWPVFTRDEAELILPEIIRCTQQARQQLNALVYPWAALPFRPYDFLRGATREELVRADWARSVARLGAQPKGYFTVDFQSPDPDIVWCWTEDENCIGHQHHVWETFADRRKINPNSSRENVE